MAVVYGGLGLIVVLTASSFGTINASPWFNLGIAVLFVLLGIAMFDVINIDFSRYSSSLKGAGSQGSMGLAFTMGGVAALLAGACVAPVVIQVVLFSSNLYAAGTPAALALPFVLGVGMAIPWPIAGAGIAALPKPGAWMTRIKQAFGVIILGTAVFYGYEAYTLFANRWVDGSEVSSSVQEKLKAGWQPSLVEGLAIAKREKQAGADRHVGDVVQELSRDGQDHARRSGRELRPLELREDQVSGGGPRRPARGEGDEVHEDVGSAHLRHHETEIVLSHKSQIISLKWSQVGRRTCD
jgi:hypothetical protein